MQLPAGDFFILDRAGPEDDEREELILELDGLPALALFTRKDRAKRFRRSALGVDWDIAAIDRADVLELLAAVYQAGVRQLMLDPQPTDNRPSIPIFRVLVESC